MIQLYYMAAPERGHRFDQVFAQLDVVAEFFPASSIPSLVAFVSRDKRIGQQDFILCDLDKTGWSDEHILSAVQLLRRFSVCRMIILAPPGEHTTALFRHLAEQRVDGLITDRGDPSAELAAALQGDNGYMRRLSAIQQGVADTAAKKASPLRIVPGLVIDVAVCGAMPRIGTTTQAISLYHYLDHLGFHPVLLDQGQSDWAMVQQLYKDKILEMDGHIQLNGIRITKERSSSFDAYVTDYGQLTKEWIAPVCAADLTILVGGVKPWELPALADAYTGLSEGAPKVLVTLLSFATPEGVEEVKKYLGDPAAVPYHPDPWAPGSDTAYRSVILPQLRKICGQG